MISISNQKPAALGIGMVSALSLALLASAGCSAEAEKSPPVEASGILETSAGSYLFTPTTCAIHKEDGVDDIEIGGPGAAPDGEILYFELSSTANALSVKLGADGPFASTDRLFQAGRFVSQEFALELSGRQIAVLNLVLVNENGQMIDDSATLTVDCSD